MICRYIHISAALYEKIKFEIRWVRRGRVDLKSVTVLVHRMCSDLYARTEMHVVPDAKYLFFFCLFLKFQPNLECADEV